MVIVDSVFTDVECKQCELLKQWLDEEKSKREFYEKLYLTKTGAFSDPEVAITTEDYKPIRKMVTLSNLKREARNKQMEAARTIIADNTDKTAAEQAFESTLKEVSNE